MMEFEREMSSDSKKSTFRMSTSFLLAISVILSPLITALIKFFFE